MIVMNTLYASDITYSKFNNNINNNVCQLEAIESGLVLLHLIAFKFTS